MVAAGCLGRVGGLTIGDFIVNGGDEHTITMTVAFCSALDSLLARKESRISTMTSWSQSVYCVDYDATYFITAG